MVQQRLEQPRIRRRHCLGMPGALMRGENKVYV